jgi:hypothetical protein
LKTESDPGKREGGSPARCLLRGDGPAQEIVTNPQGIVTMALSIGTIP